MANPVVFFDIAANGEPLGRVTFEVGAAGPGVGWGEEDGGGWVARGRLHVAGAPLGAGRERRVGNKGGGRGGKGEEGGGSAAGPRRKPRRRHFVSGAASPPLPPPPNPSMVGMRGVGSRWGLGGWGGFRVGAARWDFGWEGRDLGVRCWDLGLW